jgi:hypothetical protein
LTSHYLQQLGAQTAAQLFCKSLSQHVENAPRAATHLLKAHNPVRKSKGEQAREIHFDDELPEEGL